MLNTLNPTKVCTLLWLLSLKTYAQDDNGAYMKREHSLVKPYQGTIARHCDKA